MIIRYDSLQLSVRVLAAPHSTLERMSLDNLLSSIDAEIKRLKEARALLAGTSTGTRGQRAPTVAPAARKKTARRKLSPEARKRIADAQRKRWAEQRKAKAA